MQTLSKIVFFAVLACLLLSPASGARRHHDRERGHRIALLDHCVAARPHRLHTEHPTYPPARPSPAAVIPPDDDDDDEDRLCLVQGEARDFTLAYHEEPLGGHPLAQPAARLLPTDQPLYRTLCILLI